MSESSLSKLMWSRPLRRSRRGYDPGPDCRVCGYKRINVRHNVTPESQIEGPDYYADMLHELHEFVAVDLIRRDSPK